MRSRPTLLDCTNARMKLVALFLALIASASAFVAPLSARSSRPWRTHVVASASEDYLASTQRAVDVSQAAAEIKELIPEQYQRDPAQFKRDPAQLKEKSSGNFKFETETATTPS